MLVMPNEVYAMENSNTMKCCEKGKKHHDCCQKKDNSKHHSSEKKHNHKSCEKNSNACLCIGAVSIVAMKNQELQNTESISISSQRKYILTNDKKPSLVYLSLWLLPKIKG